MTTHERKKNMKKIIKLEMGYILTNIVQKGTQIAGKTVFSFIDWKQNRKQDKHETNNTKNKANMETERQKHTSWKETKTKEEK